MKNNVIYDYSYGNQIMNEYIHRRQPLFCCSLSSNPVSFFLTIIPQFFSKQLMFSHAQSCISKAAVPTYSPQREQNRNWQKSDKTRSECFVLSWQEVSFHSSHWAKQLGWLLSSSHDRLSRYLRKAMQIPFFPSVAPVFQFWNPFF